MKKFTPTGSAPIYLQIADWLVARMDDGTLPPDSRLPPERALGGQLGVARGTVQKAYGELYRRGRAHTLRSSGSYVTRADPEGERTCARAALAHLIRQLQTQGLRPREVDDLLREWVWARLPDQEKLRVAWVDCSPEILRANAAEIASFCNVLVTSFTEEAVLAQPGLLGSHLFDFAVTTINHYDELRAKLPPGLPLEMVVLALSHRTISGIARIQPDYHVAVLYGSEAFRYFMQRYLLEFGVRAHFTYVPLHTGLDGFYHRLPHYNMVIFPPDRDYQNHVVDRALARCVACGVEPLLVEQRLDSGSLLHLKALAQSIWMKSGRLTAHTFRDEATAPPSGL